MDQCSDDDDFTIIVEVRSQLRVIVMVSVMIDYDGDDSMRTTLPGRPIATPMFNVGHCQSNTNAF